MEAAAKDIKLMRFLMKKMRKIMRLLVNMMRKIIVKNNFDIGEVLVGDLKQVIDKTKSLGDNEKFRILTNHYKIILKPK